MSSREDDLLNYGVGCEEDIVRILNERFQRQQYYVEAGDVLVTVNPWKTLSNIDKEIVDFSQLYRNKDKHDTFPAHPCGVAEKAVRNAADCVIIPLGESGSGKSSNIQMILHYLAIRSNTKEKISKDEILAINEVLDLFCNARTLICRNSTRCLKVHEVFFETKEQTILGVNVKISLLDKLRVINQIKGEGNFNIFHLLINGLNSEQLQQYFLDDNHRYVPFLSREEFTDEGNSLSVSLKCLERIGLNEKEIEEVLHFVTAIILLGDLKFGESSKRDVLSFQNGEVLEKAAMLLGISCATLAELIVTKSKKVKGHKLSLSASCSNAAYECDRMAVICYETLVMWIEGMICYRYSAHSRFQSDYSVVLLDVFGWENYSLCSFEQLCINSTNEALQSTYNAVIFKSYEVDLADENIYLPEPCLKFDLPGAVPFLFKPKGFLDVVHFSAEAESRINDLSLLKKLGTLFKKEPRYINNSNQEFPGFLIEHFIGEVSYDVTGFVVQSKNWLNDNVLTCLRGSKKKTVSTIAQERINRENASLEKSSFSDLSPKKSSVVEKDWLKTTTFVTNSGKEKKKLALIKNSNPAIIAMTLTALLQRISSSKVYFIRCLNSNIAMQPDVFDYERILRQVRYSNLHGTVKTRLACLKLCFSLTEFITRYRLLFFHLSRPVSASSELCHSVLSKMFDESQFRVGKTKVFLSRSAMMDLDENLRKRFLQIIIIQKVFRGFLARKQYQSLIRLKKRCDDQRLSFYSEITDGISAFHDHLALQISEDQRRLKQHKLKQEHVRSESNQNSVTESETPVTSSGSQGHCMSYVWNNEVITDETLESSTWCKVACFQRADQLAMFSVKEPKVTIDGTNQIFTTDRIGFGSFVTPSHDKQMKKVKSCIGKGVELYLAHDGSLIAVRLCKNPIFVKGYFCEDKLLKSLGELSKNEESKVFSYRNFSEKVNYECHPARLAIDSEARCLAMCVVHLCFVKNSENDEGAPCWAEVILTQALQYVKRVVSLSMQQRREVQEKYHFKQPPALRMDSKMESTSAKILKLIRPSRYIETVKFKRKAWARKIVVSNPFLYGEDSFSEEDQSSETTSPRSPDSFNGEEGLYETSEDVFTSQENEEEGEVVYENLPETMGKVKDVRGKWLNFFEISKVVPMEGDASGSINEERTEKEMNQFKLIESQNDSNLANSTHERVSVFESDNHSYVKNVESPYANLVNIHSNSLEVEHSSNQSSLDQRTKHAHQAQQDSVRNQNLELHEEYLSEHKMSLNMEKNFEDLYENVDARVDSRWKSVSRQENNEFSGTAGKSSVDLNRARVERFGVNDASEMPLCEATGSSPIIKSFNTSFSSEVVYDLPRDIPSPDYDDSVYANLLQIDREENSLIEQNADMHASWIRHEERYSVNEYENYSSSSKQHIQEHRSGARVKSSEGFNSTVSAVVLPQQSIKPRMSFPRL